MKPVLETKRLRVIFKGSRSHREVVAVEDLTIRVNQGEVVGFIGSNGADARVIDRVFKKYFQSDE